MKNANDNFSNEKEFLLYKARKLLIEYKERKIGALKGNIKSPKTRKAMQ